MAETTQQFLLNISGVFKHFLPHNILMRLRHVIGYNQEEKTPQINLLLFLLSLKHDFTMKLKITKSLHHQP
ncbi:CLUMA_CG007311, isoform A [Clunio marinus]|uniref:CLUMA_CG007311, isoform A n=1 Tax=Clunio marinus TaxID=568069 RepID=A0A1J1I0A2_9DIPT|nr:CLUMA_CG007311, isoform A [Clunio marinus]